MTKMDKWKEEMQYVIDDNTLEFVRCWLETKRSKASESTNEDGSKVLSITTSGEEEEFRSWKTILWTIVDEMEGVDNVHYGFPDDDIPRVLIHTYNGSYIAIGEYADLVKEWKVNLNLTD